jgi:hypothetical protein
MLALMVAAGVPFTGMLVDRPEVQRVLLPVIVLFSAAISFTPASPAAFITVFAGVGARCRHGGPRVRDHSSPAAHRISHRE